jgi:DNA-binding NtrC family response regulator
MHSHIAGTCFEGTLQSAAASHIVLPESAELTAQQAFGKPVRERPTGSGLVLLVDDEEMVLRLTGTILERHGYQVITGLNGRIGVQKVRDNCEQLALVILDLIMPVMGGVEAFAGIKSIAPMLPVILMTGYDPIEAAGRFQKGVLAGFIQKPGSVPELLRTVKAALRKQNGRLTEI